MLAALLFLGAASALLSADPTAFPAPSLLLGFVGATAMADAVAAVLLFSLYVVDGDRGVLFAAIAYLSDAILVVPYGITFSGVYAPGSLLATPNSAATIWMFWHLSFAVLMGCSALPVVIDDRSRRLRTVATALAFALPACALAIIAATVGWALIPQMVVGPSLNRMLTGIDVLVTLAVIGVFVRRRTLTTLRVWFLIALVASALDLILNVFAPERYSLAWYIGKADQFITACVVLFAMLGTWARAHIKSHRLADQLTRSLRERDELALELDRELRASSAFQAAALPASLPNVPGLTFSAMYRAADSRARVGGDWYDAFQIDDGRVVLTVGDVVGTGLSAAVTMNAVRQTIRGAAQIFPEPMTILAAADRVLRSERPDAIVTAFVAVLDPITRVMEYASAGHPPVMLKTGDGVIALGTSGLPIGIRSMTTTPETSESSAIPDRSVLIFYTDGLIEAGHDPVAGEAALRAAIAATHFANSEEPAALLSQMLISAVSDDIAIMVVGINLAARAYLNRSPGDPSWSFDVADGARARQTLAEFTALLGDAGAPDDAIQFAELMFSELIGNVVRHAPGSVEIFLDMSGEKPVLHMLDRGAGFTYLARLPASMLAESGRGLFIVSSLAHDFSVMKRASGGSHARLVLNIELRAAVPS